MRITKHLPWLVSGFLLPLTGWSQGSSPRIVSTIDRGDYLFIPAEAFEPEVAGIAYQVHPGCKAAAANIPIELFWNSACTDGQYRVTITPEQVYFSDGHENPNPDRLYWVFNITRSQYETIKQQLTHQRPAGFLDLSKEVGGESLLYKSTARNLVSFPEGWSDKQYSTYCDSERRKHLAAIFKLLNTALVPAEHSLQLPSKDTPRLFSYMKEEILDWLPHIPQAK